MSSKFEQLLDLIVNEDRETADALFHEIIVDMSRDIYENIIAEEADEDEDESMYEASEEDEDESMYEASEEEDEDYMESMFGEEEEEFPVQDQTDDFEDDVEDHDMMGDKDGHDMMGDDSEAATKGDIHDLESALEELKAEFEKLMAGEDAEEHDHPGIHDIGGPDVDDDEFGDEDEMDEEMMCPHCHKSPCNCDDEEDESMMAFERRLSQGETMREYIEKVTATMDGGLVGARTGENVPAPKEGKSPISSGSGKPTSGANAKNIAQSEKGQDQDGTKPYGKIGGVLKQGQDIPHAGNFLNTEKSGQKAKGMYSAAKKPAKGEGHPVGAGTGKDSVTGATNTRSIESGK